MDDRGLHASIWAGGRRGRGGGNKSGFARAQGDWVCPSCGFDNFSWRGECFRCNRSRASTPTPTATNETVTEADATPTLGEPSRVGDPKNKRGGLGNGLQAGGSLIGDPGGENGSRMGNGSQVSTSRGLQGPSIIGDPRGSESILANGSQAYAPLGLNPPSMLGDSTQHDSTSRLGNNSQRDGNVSSIIGDSHGLGTNARNTGKGLATSRWAPRTHNSRYNDGKQVWTRVAPVSKPISQPISRPPSPPDLGLPYEVQHYILSMMQCILEEGCYEFASRWVPSMLLSRNWTCSEAVELAAWKKFLPSAIPYNALTGSYSLEAGLTDAVRIRNAAVHRHLCDNREIRVMAIRAGDLMGLFGDGSRKEKFGRLKEELIKWDEGCQGDREVARRRLEDALREIGERDMDDMDWTPNAVSLQEIKVNDGKNMVESYVDEMELD